MSEHAELPPDPEPPGDDCPLSVGRQNWNIGCFTVFWASYYFAAPVSYIGLTHANLLKGLGNNDTVSNLPLAMYLWLAVVPVLIAWFLPHPRYFKLLALLAIGTMAAVTAGVALALWSNAASSAATWTVVAHGAVFGGANGVVITALWDLLRRGVSTSRRGKALGFAFGVGPLFACVGALVQDALLGGELLGGLSSGLEFPRSYMAMFAVASPLFLVSAACVALFELPQSAAPQSVELTESRGTPLKEIMAGLRQFVGNRAVLVTVAIYIMVYSGGNAIFVNVSLHAQDVLADQADTLGLQSFLRFGCKAAAGAALGWLLAAANPRATLLATTSILLLGMSWALASTGWWFMLTFGLLGAGELFGAHFSNYVTTASAKSFVWINMAYLNLLSSAIGLTSIAFGAISDHYGRRASFYVAASLLGAALLLIVRMLPADPTPRETPHASLDDR